MSDVSDWQLELYALDELGPEEKRAIAARLSAEPELQRRIDALHLSTEQFFAEHPVASAIEHIDRRQRLRAVPRRWLLALPVAAVVVLALGPWVLRDDDVRMKGTPGLVVFRQVGERPELVTDQWVKAGDRLQLGYHATRGMFGAIVSIDGRGVVTRHWPQGEHTDAMPLADSATLPFSYELDDAPGFERFSLFWSYEPFAVDPIVEALRRAPQAKVAPPKGVSVTSVVVRKERP